MYVIYCDQTGEEIDRVETRDEALNLVIELERVNTWEETFSFRWEV